MIDKPQSGFPVVDNTGRPSRTWMLWFMSVWNTIKKEASPTFSGLTLTGNQVINGGNLVVGANITRAYGITNYADNTSRSVSVIEQDGTGDAELGFLLTGTRYWAFGIDNSDAKALKMCPVEDAFASAVWRMSVTGDMTVTGYLGGGEKSADPADPAEGRHVIWQSDGTGSGDDGDILCKVTAGGVTKTATLVDFSAV